MQRADIGRGAADIDDDGVGHARQIGGAAHGIGRPGREGQNRELLGEGGIHQRAVVLGQEKAALDAGLGNGVAKGRDHVMRQVAQTGVHDRRVFPLEQADTADIARQGDVGARQGLGENFAGLLFEIAIDRREDRGNGNGIDPLGLDVGGDLQQFLLVQRRDDPSVELVAAMGEIGMPANRLLEIVRPVDHGRQGGRRRQAEPHGGGFGEGRGAAPRHW